jgi:AAA ATPase domain
MASRYGDRCDVAMGDPAPHPGSWAFVGRDRDMAELVAGLEDAAGGRGRLFLIAGEPGIGKTWLAEHLAGLATGRGTRVLWGRCWEAGGAPPFWPWAQLLGALAEGCDDESFAAWLGVGAAQVAQLIPGLAEGLGPSAVPAAPARESDAARFSVRRGHRVVQARLLGAAAAAGLRRSACGR